jgi:ferrous iron transport protein B
MQAITVGIVGNPNCGKSTLFNALTGARQKVGNWPGVTVEHKSGQFEIDGQQVEVVDLPGVYSLITISATQSLDERIACDFILNRQADLIVNIVDATNLERNLYLTALLLTMHVPVVMAVNMMDIAQKRQIIINLPKLSELLGCPVVGLTANKGKGILELKQAIYQTVYKNNGNCSNTQTPAAKFVIDYPPIIINALTQIAKEICSQQSSFQLGVTQQELSSIDDLSFNEQAIWLAQQLLQNDEFVTQKAPAAIRDLATKQRTLIEQELQEDCDIIFAGLVYSFASRITCSVVSQHAQQKTLTRKIDAIVLNRFLGIPIFLVVMYGMFFFAINLGGAFQDFFDISSNTVFVQGLSHLLHWIQAPDWLVAVLAAGFGRGINTIVSFIPVIAGMFLFLSWLEGSGYMARAAFVIDRFMRLIGLPGKSFVPMIVGFGCNVPAILAARTLENPRDRALTILLSPFMSCGARLAIYAVFTAAFFPKGGQNIVFALYTIGILMAIVTGLILRRTLLKGDPSPLVLELPPYHLPMLRGVCLQTWHRLQSFIFRAGKLIIPICMLIGILNAINIDGSLNEEESNQASVLSAIGRAVTPVFAPMGIHGDNWPATVGLVTGILAKEVVVATLNTLYMQENNSAVPHNQSFSLWEGLRQAVISIPTNLANLKNSLGSPVSASASSHTMSHHVYSVMYQCFGSQVSAFAYLLFVLLYFPCVSATAVMLKELNRGWAIFSVLWTTGIAYGVAVLFYQSATFNSHPTSSLVWIVILIAAFLAVLWGMEQYACRKDLELHNQMERA